MGSLAFSDDAALLFGRILRVIESSSPSKPVHVPQIVYFTAVTPTQSLVIHMNSEKGKAPMNNREEVSSAQVLQDSKPEEYDLVILGGGTGSTLAAWTFASEGKRVAVIDRKYIGGSCPNIACLPSKNIIHSAKVASYVSRSEEFGIAKEHFRLDMAKVRDRK